MVPMQYVTQSLRVWIYADADQMTRLAWGSICDFGNPGVLIPINRLQGMLGDEVIQACRGSLISWTRSDGWICHTRFDVSIQESAGFWGGMNAISASVRANREGSGTSSLKIECTLASHLGDSKLADRVKRPVQLAAALFCLALDANEIKYRVG
jgi:hypothetical protein